MTNITIEIHYLGAGKLMKRAFLPLRGRRPEQVAFEFWKQIKKEMPHHVELEEVIAAGEEITQEVKDLEKQERYNAFNDNLPF